MVLNSTKDSLIRIEKPDQEIEGGGAVSNVELGSGNFGAKRCGTFERQIRVE